MKSSCFGGVCVAGVMAAFSMAVYAQDAAAPNKSSAQQAAAADQQVTITGCIQREADFRKARDAGKGGVVGTGVGAGNEFVLINASMSTGAAPSPAGTSGVAGAGMAYELTGSNEGQADKFVGQRVEIAGKLKAADVTAAGRPTGGPTAGKPPEGVDVVGGDLKLRELEITSIRQSAGAACPK